MQAEPGRLGKQHVAVAAVPADQQGCVGKALSQPSERLQEQPHPLHGSEAAGVDEVRVRARAAAKGVLDGLHR